MSTKKEQSKSWILTVEEDPDTGDGILTFPQDLLDETGWKEGDTLEWIDLENGAWQLKKKVV
ncbi:AbrB/MazE/SpoVT family DNA-binding domain-containing protein [bacterium]|nr:AbrB/MazE/SpoVT family DNA-binding domain-containing protein [Candidatus Elulimicrobium humile]